MKVILHEGVPVCEVEMSGGRVFLWKPIGPEAWFELFALYPEPEAPRKEFINELGTKTTVRIEVDDPLFIAYVAARDKRNAALNRLISEIERLDSAEFIDVPAGWEVPHAFQRAGIVTETDPDELKLQYIRYEVLKTSGDSDLMTQAMRGGAEISPEEIAAAVPFSVPPG